MDDAARDEILEGEDGPEREPLWWASGARVLLVVALVGAAAGALGMRAWDTRPTASQPPAPVIDVRVSLGARAGGLIGTDQGKAVVAVDSVVLNAGSQDLVLVGVKVVGPGAAFLPDVAGGPSTALPIALPRGQFVDIRFGLSSDCSVAVRPLPTVTLVVRDPANVEHQIVTRIPDLDAVWGQSLDPSACSGG